MNKDEKLGILNIDTTLYQTRLNAKYLNRKLYKPADPRLILSFIPGTVIDIMVKPGDVVKMGDDLMILDAMKMKNRLKSSMDGTVKAISVKTGDKVSKGTLLLELE